jgi:hypothetical protein
MTTITVIVAANIQPNSSNPGMPTITPPAVSIDIAWGGVKGSWGWSPGAGPGMSLSDVDPNGWQLVKPQAQININGNFGSPASFGTAFELTSWGTPTSDPNINDIGTGIFNGSSDDMPATISWFVSNIF